MFEFTPYLTLTNTVTLVCGGLVTVFALRAYRRTASQALGALAIGFGLVTFGGLLAGVLHELFTVPIGDSIAVQSTFTALGFVVLTYAIYTPWTKSASDPENPQPR